MTRQRQDGSSINYDGEQGRKYASAGDEIHFK